MDIKHAFTGARVMQLAMDDDTIVLDWARRWISEAQNVPAFTAMFLTESGQEIPPSVTWSDLDNPSQLLVLFKPITSSFTGAFFKAIEAMDVASVRNFLSQGQDPHSVLEDAALTFASLCSSQDIAQSLLLGNANPDFIPPGRSGALRTATCAGQTGVVCLLLAAGATPDLWDLNDCSTPAHDAACLGRSDVLELLFDWGADPLLQDRDGDNVFTLSRHGASTCICMRQCWSQLLWEDVMVRHVEAIVAFAPTEALFYVTKRLAKQRNFFGCMFEQEDDGGTDPDSVGMAGFSETAIFLKQ